MKDIGLIEAELDGKRIMQNSSMDQFWYQKIPPKVGIPNGAIINYMWDSSLAPITGATFSQAQSYAKNISGWFCFIALLRITFFYDGELYAIAEKSGQVKGELYTIAEKSGQVKKEKQ